ncbi:MAG TPA: hypothetical protein VK701_04135, partial [Solirubrobacteraceae bacterium]|nr:hypothetical protein [Solirubrobacteraceae bacterium]
HGPVVRRGAERTSRGNPNMYNDARCMGGLSVGHGKGLRRYPEDRQASQEGKQNRDPTTPSVDLACHGFHGLSA